MALKKKLIGMILLLIVAGFSANALAAIELERSFSTGFFSGTADKPMEIVSFKFKNTGSEAVKNIKVEITSDSLTKMRTDSISVIEPNDADFVRTFLTALPRGGSGTASFHIKAIAEGKEYNWEAVVARTPPDWRRIHLLTHFHYDPVWIHKDGQRGYALSAISLIQQYMNVCRQDPTYSFVLEQVPYLKPFWDNYPESREALQGLMGKKQLELVNGGYDQPDESSVFGEGLIRNYTYGRLFEEEVMKGKVTAAWQIDNFGHTSQLPQILKKSGIESFTFLRGGPVGLPRQYMWIAPDGTDIFSYDLGIKDELAKVIDGKLKVDKKEDVSMELIQKLENELLPDVIAALKDAHGVHSFLLPLGDDFMPPIPLLGTLTRYWQGRYLYPSLRFSLPTPYYNEALKEVADRPMEQRYTTKDMNPVFTGCYSSRTDTKIANRQAEMSYLDAEYLATVANLLGAAYPSRALDKSLRELLFNEHHDSIPGTSNELSYLDILYGWRESLILSRDVRGKALKYIAGKADTSSAGDSIPLFVMNTLSAKRTDGVEVDVSTPITDLQTKDGTKAPFDLYKNGSSFKLRFTAADVPSMGYKVYYAKSGKVAAETIENPDISTIENEFYKIEVDALKGGGIIHLIDKKTGIDWAAEKNGRLMNTLFVQKDDGDLWGLKLSGGYTTSKAPAFVDVVKGKTFSKIIAISDHPDFSVEQTIILQAGVPRVDFMTRVCNFKGENKLFKLVFPVANHKGLTPVYGERFTPLARKFGEEFPADQWASLSKALTLSSKDGETPLGVPAIVVHKNDEVAKIFLKTLIEAMIKVGSPSVTYFEEEKEDTTTDSAIYIGDPASFAALNGKLGDKSGAAADSVYKNGMAILIKGERPLWMIGKKIFSDSKAVNGIVESIIKNRTINAPAAALLTPMPFKSIPAATIALINNGSNGYRFADDGSIELQMLRSATGRPGGEAYERAFSKEDWNSVFHYSLIAGGGDWEHMKTESAAMAANRPLLASWTDVHKGDLPGDSLSFFSVDSGSVYVSAIKMSDESIPSYSRTKKPQGTAVRVYSDLATKTPFALKSYFPIKSATKTNMLERDAKPLNLTAGAVKDEIGARAIETYVLGIDAAKTDGTEIGQNSEPVQPIYSAYWRHNDNVAPLGYQPVTVSFEPAQEKGIYEMEVKLKIASDYTDINAKGLVNIKTPTGWSATPEKVEYDLVPGGFSISKIRIIPKQDGSNGVVRAYYENEGQMFYASISIGEIPKPTITVPSIIEISPGETKTATISLKGDNSHDISGEAVIVSPIGSWEESPETLQVAFTPFRMLFVIPSNGSSDFSVKISAKDNALSGSYWFVVKLMANGDYTYSKPVEVLILP